MSTVTFAFSTRQPMPFYLDVSTLLAFQKSAFLTLWSPIGSGSGSTCRTFRRDALMMDGRLHAACGMRWRGSWALEEIGISVAAYRYDARETNCFDTTRCLYR